jgi:predicted MFS family arabinose efflux permease
MNINLKKTHYNSLFEGLLLTIGGGIMCGSMLYSALTKKLDNSTIIIGFSLFAGILLLGIWKLIKKKSSEYIDINGWKYKLYKKANKYQFMLITGGINTLGYIILLFCFFFFNIFSWTADDFTIRFILLITTTVIILIVVSGYIQYKKYSSIDMDSEFDEILKP